MMLYRYNNILDPLINSGAIYVLVGILIAIMFIWPIVGLTAFLAWLPIQQIFPAEGLMGSISKWFGLLVLLTSLYSIFKRIDRVLYTKEVYIFFIFILWSFFSIIWSHDKSACFLRGFTQLQLFMLYVIIITATDRGNYPLLLKGFVIGATLSLLTIPFFLGSKESYDMRAAGGGMDENEYASTIAIALVLALTWVQIEKKYWKKILPLVFLPLGLIAIAYTKSRTGTLALLPFAIYLPSIIKNKRVGIKILSIFMIMAAVMVVFYLMPEGYIARVTEIDKQSGHRVFIWNVALKIIADNFLLGVGSSNFSFAFSKYSKSLFETGVVAHNSYIGVLAELGIIGLFIFLWLFYCHAKNILSFIKSNKNDEQAKIIGKGLFFALMAYLMASMTLSWEYTKMIPFILGSIVLLSKGGQPNNSRG